MSYDVALSKVMVELREKLLAKHHDYGTGNLLKDGELGILIRASDKVERLRHITKDEMMVADETIEDTWFDLAGYALQAILMRRGALCGEEHDGIGVAVKRASSLHCPKCGNGLVMRTWMGHLDDRNASIVCPTCQRSFEFNADVYLSKGSLTALIMERLYYETLPTPEQLTRAEDWE